MEHINSLNDFLQISKIDLVRHLLETDSRSLPITIKNGQVFDAAIQHLTNEQHWNDYKIHIDEETDKVNIEIEHLKITFSTDQEEKRRLFFKKEIYLTFLNLCKYLNYEIDTIINNEILQQIVIEQNDIRNKYKHMIPFNTLYEELDQYIDEHNILQKANESGHIEEEQFNKLINKKNQIKDQENLIKEKLLAYAEENKIQSLIKQIKIIEAIKKYEAKRRAHRNALNNVLNAGLITEESFEITSSVSDTLQASDENTQMMDMIFGDTETTNPESGTETEHLTSGGEFLSVIPAIPLVNEFVRGLLYLREAYVAYKNPNDPKRGAKIASALFGASVSIGIGIVGALFLAGTGLMATAAALTITPIVLAALTFGVYTITLSRDFFALQHSRKQVENTKDKISLLNNELAEAKENVISQFSDRLESNDPIKNIQMEINALRKLDHTPHHINKIKELCQTRNQLIYDNTNMREQLRSEYHKDTHVARTSFNISQLQHSLDHLRKARSASKRNVALSTACLIGIGLLMTPLFITGIGAFVVTVAASVAIGYISYVRIRDHYRKKAEQAKLHSEASHPNKTLENHSLNNMGRKPVHTSVLDIENILLVGNKNQIANALIQTSPDKPSTIPNSETKSTNITEDPKHAVSNKQNDNLGKNKNEQPTGSHKLNH